MQISLTQLQGYNTMAKLLDSYYKKTNSDDFGGLLGDMSFLVDGCTADPAIWGDWTDAISDKSTLTKQEAFDGMIRFLEIYHDLTSSADAKSLIDEMRSAKTFIDVSISLVQHWNLYIN